MGYWRYTEAGKGIDRPSRNGIHIDGPLTADDLKKIIEDLLEEIIDLAKEEGARGG